MRALMNNQGVISVRESVTFQCWLSHPHIWWVWAWSGLPGPDPEVFSAEAPRQALEILSAAALRDRQKASELADGAADVPQRSSLTMSASRRLFGPSKWKSSWNLASILSRFKR